MARCYPTGCTPCDQPLDFPENPKNGQRHCVKIGSNNETKCWVYDECVPAWRAEGPAGASTRFRGSLDITVSETANGITRNTPEDQWTGNPPQPPTSDLAAGDSWILSKNADASDINSDFDDNLAGDDYVKGENIFYDGSAYERSPAATQPYAEAATEGLPLDKNNDKVKDPDPREGGIVKNATVEQALAGVNKCDTITPYTLQKRIDEIPGATKVNDGKLTIKHGNDTLDKFTANQEGNTTVTVPKPGNGRVTIEQNGTTYGDFRLNQSQDDTITLPNINNSKITLKRNGVKLGDFTLNQAQNETIDYGSDVPSDFLGVGTYTVMHTSEIKRLFGSPNQPDIPVNSWAAGSILIGRNAPIEVGSEWRVMSEAFGPNPPQNNPEFPGLTGNVNWLIVRMT